MKFSESWLREWVNPNISSEQLAEQLTMAGFEVDSIDKIAGDFSKVVVGEVMTCMQHPDADKLRVTTVNIGNDILLDIVCGAPNCRQGLKVAVATVGAVLPGDFIIKEAKLRGQPSMGMLCSFTELGIDIETDGIIELPNDAPLGCDIRDYLKLDDVTIEIDLTANRGDCLSIKGIAREVAVINRMSVSNPTWEAVTPSIDATLPINILAPNACPRYLGRIIKGVNKNATTPSWMVEKLRRVGIRSIDPIVDITNFVLIEMGQPMHAFDLQSIDTQLEVRFAKEGEKLTLLDGNEIILNPEVLVIADKTKALALGGIFGGKDSGINDNTQDILLECAFFAPLAILGKARTFGLHTDSSHRYERGVDPTLQALAIDRATRLILDICGGECGPVIEAKSEKDIPTHNPIVLRRQKLDNLLGHKILDNDVTDILQRLGFNVVKNNDTWDVTSATYRFDIAIEEDLIEEVARIYGYNNIPNVEPIVPIKMLNHFEAKLSLNKVKTTLVAKGYTEAITYSFVDPTLQKRIHPSIEPLMLSSPISKEMSAMRLSLWTGLLNAVSYNQNRQQSRVRLFETGLRYVPNDTDEFGVSQEQVLSGVITGSVFAEQWGIALRPVDFFDLKGDLDAIFSLSAATDEFSFKSIVHPALHPGQAACIYRNDVEIGIIGVLHPSLEKPFNLQSRAILFEVKLDAILDANLPKSHPISKFPAIRRDIAILIDESVTIDSIMNTIKINIEKDLLDINLFDIYQGQSVKLGKKSIALAIRLQNITKTLEDLEIKAAIDKVVLALHSEFGATLRD